MSADEITRVVIESPFAGKTEEERERNKRYLKAAVLDCLGRGESPYSSHGFFTHFLDDDVLQERMLGMLAGQAWYDKADLVVVYIDCGISRGMEVGTERAETLGLPVERRTIDGWAW